MLVMAASLLSQRVAWLLERPLLFLTRRRPSAGGSGLVLGVSLGLVFVPCAGPVLAAVTVLAASGEVGLRIILVTGVYSIGFALPLLAIAIGGQRLTTGVGVLRAHAAATRKVAGVVLGVGALAIALGVDQKVTTALPVYGTTFQERLERNSSVRSELRRLTGSGPDQEPAAGAAAPRAPKFQGIKLWLNTPEGKPVSIAGLRGKVVLVDFWTYSCINCLRTLPHLRAWDRVYRSSGLVIVGIHSPEFAFERVPGNVRSAIRRLGLRYPVGLDNDFGTWRAYDNDYWPSKYLIDRSGRIRSQHYGEGSYRETEGWIRRLLGEKVRVTPTTVADTTPNQETTPESYLGYARLDRFAGRTIAFDQEATYRFPQRSLYGDELAYAGRWKVEPSRIVAGRDARLRLSFQAKDIFLVLAGTGRLGVYVNGRSVRTVEVAGTPRLYTLVRYPRLANALLELRFSPGLEAYAFTFG
jgi:thiol-disulfide isomerase/thioredoxin